MKLSLSTNWCNRRINDGREIAEKALELGFEELELGFHTTAQQVAGFKAMLGRIPVGSVHAFCPVPLSEGVLEGDAFDAIEEVFSSRGVDGVFEKAQAGKRLAEVLAEVKDESEPEDVALARKAFYKTIMKFVRGWMVKGELPRQQAFKNVAAVEDAFRQSERYLSDDAVLVNLADRLVWPEWKELRREAFPF